MAINPNTSKLQNIAAGVITSGVISGLTNIATGFINSQRTKNTYDFNSKMAQLEGDFNAKMTGLQGRMTRLSADIEIKNIRKRASSLYGQQVADYAKAGFAMEGSPVAVIMNDLKEAELDEIYTNISADYNVGLQKTQGDIYRIGADAQSGLNKMAGKSAGIDAWTSAGNTILKIGTKIATRT